ncbi:unnamed protein product [Angiostrongylus costaricensis]|uniref:Secreted protein n=1 Tax=Angiostrongylus costaricensis TaxID=334426 RepID=A0A0R3PUY3_ANGCS|nr:unnamed protein product [Angiostrongylus costaricensis]
MTNHSRFFHVLKRFTPDRAYRSGFHFCTFADFPARSSSLPMVLELLPLWLLLIRTISAVPSIRGKCSLECYSRCMQSGTVSGILSENLSLSYCFTKLLKLHRPTFISGSTVDPTSFKSSQLKHNLLSLKSFSWI